MAKDDKQEQVTLTADALKEMVSAAVATAIAESKKPYVDPVKQAEDEARYQQALKEQLASEQAKRDRVLYCSHQRNDGSYNVHGLVCCDGKLRITCGNCNGIWNEGDPLFETLRQKLAWHMVGNAVN